jgi:anti-anti-sigma factor
MLNVSVQNFEGATILRCQGRIVAGDENRILREAVVSHSDTGMLVVDLLQVDRIDAGGLGLLLSLLAWTRSKGTQLRLANLTRRVQDLFRLTRLDQVFAISSVDEIFPREVFFAQQDQRTYMEPVSGIRRNDQSDTQN